MKYVLFNKSCFKEKFPDSYRNIKEKLGDDCKKKIFVDIKQSIGNNTDEVPGIEIRETRCHIFWP